MSKSNRVNTNKPSNGQPAGEPKPKAAVRKRTAAKAKDAHTDAAPHSDARSETNMEVHHHPQLEHKHKPWKEYLLEGFMIFIAVMMGFIAENIRESIDNSEHAQQLTSQLINELKADTAKLNQIDSAEKVIIRNNDSLFNQLQLPTARIDFKKIQLFIAGSHSIWLFHPSSGAINAIKNELHLKQFSNSDIINHISSYEEHIELLHTVQDIALQYQRSFLDPFLYQHFTPANLNAAFNNVSAVNGLARNLTQEDLTQLAAQVVLIRVNSHELEADNRKVLKAAVDMLQYVKKQYDLEE